MVSLVALQSVVLLLVVSAPDLLPVAVSLPVVLQLVTSLQLQAVLLVLSPPAMSLVVPLTVVLTPTERPVARYLTVKRALPAVLLASLLLIVSLVVPPLVIVPLMVSHQMSCPRLFHCSLPLYWPDR